MDQKITKNRQIVVEGLARAAAGAVTYHDHPDGDAMLDVFRAPGRRLLALAFINLDEDGGVVLCRSGCADDLRIRTAVELALQNPASWAVWDVNGHQSIVSPVADEPGDEPTPRRERSRVPAEPLMRAITERGGPTEVGIWGAKALDRAYCRAQARGALTVRAADQLAVEVLGVHPCAIWGDQWWELSAAA